MEVVAVKKERVKRFRQMIQLKRGKTDDGSAIEIRELSKRELGSKRRAYDSPGLIYAVPYTRKEREVFVNWPFATTNQKRGCLVI